MYHIGYKEGIYQLIGTEPDLLLNAEITNDVIDSIGNNHAGSYYPAVRDALPLIVHVALQGNHAVSRNCAINILIDLYRFYPDNQSIDLRELVQRTIKNVIMENRSNFGQFAIDDARNKSLINSLMCIVDGEC